MTSVGFMLAPPQIIKRETRRKQAGNSTNGGQGRNRPPTLMATVERRFLPRRSFQAKAGPIRAFLLESQHPPGRRPVVAEAMPRQAGAPGAERQSSIGEGTRLRPMGRAIGYEV